MSYQSFNLSEQTEEYLDLCITKHGYYTCLMEQLCFFFFIHSTHRLCAWLHKRVNLSTKKKNNNNNKKRLQDSVHKTCSPLSSLIQLIQRTMCGVRPKFARAIKKEPTISRRRRCWVAASSEPQSLLIRNTQEQTIWFGWAHRLQICCISDQRGPHRRQMKNGECCTLLKVRATAETVA